MISISLRFSRLPPFRWTLACLLASALLGGSAAAQKAPLSERLEGFDSQIQQVMDDWSVPGLAIAVVTDSTVVWSRGYGERNVEADAPVTDRTLFAIGSTTKAFTAAGLGMLHDEGQLDWSTPVREYLPRFTMQNEFATKEMTPIDLLTHRSGLPRHDLLWYATDYSRKSLFQRLRHLAPSASFRSTFQYQNLMYMTAGYLAGEISGLGWETFTRRRLLNPLGMARSTFSVDSMQTTDDYARPYGGDRDTIEAVDYHSLDAIGPAGAINSSVSEMTAWVQLLLNDGRHGNTQLIDSTTVAQLIRPRIVLEDIRPFMPETGGSLLYALGWFKETHGGTRLLWHSGGIDGFSAMVGMMPEREVGWVILTNKGGTPAPSVLLYELVDRVLDREGPNWNQRIRDFYAQQQAEPDTARSDTTEAPSDTTAAPGPSHPLGDYVATYSNPGYGTFEVTMEDDSLVGRYGRFSSTLRHKQYDVFELHPEVGGGEQTFKVQFESAMDGTIDEAKIPMESAVDPIVFARTADEALTSTNYLQQFTGEYAFQGQTLTVRLRGDDTLTLTVPGQPTHTLEPTSENAFTLKDQSGFRVEFKMTDGTPTQMVLHQPNGTFTAERKQSQ
ncbi:MAG: serine hydrolase [Salinibacter sp.]|uniref:serine hydrolase n=1 Tax=Salinibacter sp. TaxID=2065818 RepID=UPI0035D48A9D